MDWTPNFAARAGLRSVTSDPDWTVGSTLLPPVVASLQRFQVGESGDGAGLITLADAAGDPNYARAVRFFVAEEQNHARLLAELLRAGGHPTVSSHWSDRIFVRCRRALGLRCEMLVLSTAELVALRYYGALAESSDALLREVSTRILEDEVHHVRFQRDRLSDGFARTPAFLRTVAGFLWQAFAVAVVVVVAVDHGPALRAVGTTRGVFIVECCRLVADFRIGVFGCGVDSALRRLRRSAEVEPTSPASHR